MGPSVVMMENYFQLMDIYFAYMEKTKTNVFWDNSTYHHLLCIGINIRLWDSGYYYWTQPGNRELVTKCVVIKF